MGSEISLGVNESAVQPGWNWREMMCRRWLQEVTWKGVERIVKEEGELRNGCTETKVIVSVSFFRCV